MTTDQAATLLATYVLNWPQTIVTDDEDEQ